MHVFLNCKRHYKILFDNQLTNFLEYKGQRTFKTIPNHTTIPVAVGV